MKRTFIAIFMYLAISSSSSPAAYAASAPIQQENQNNDAKTSHELYHFSENESQAWINFTGLEEHQIIINVKLNGEDVSALLDTGSPNGVTISKEWAERHGLALVRIEDYDIAINNGAAPFTAQIKDITIGAYHQNGGSVSVMDLSKFSQVGNNHDFDMIIGLAAIKKLVTEINFDKSQIRFLLRSTPPENGIKIKTPIDLIKTRITGDFSINDSRIGKFIIDTGSTESIEITASYLNNIKAIHDKTDLVVYDVFGIHIYDYFRAAQVAWGDVKFSNVPTIVESAPVDKGTDGQIGLQMLERYNVYIDGPNEFIILTSRQNAAPPPLITNMGIQGNITDSGWTVAHVMKNSPAATAGLKDGDQICAVDGKKLTASSDIPRGPDGSTMHIVLCDGRKIDLVRRTFY